VSGRTPGRRRYGQFCGLAAALDQLGERWSLLVIRELLLGPARFGDILRNLPGIGPKLLTDRLRSLVANGVVEAVPVDSDGRGRAYGLTESGAELREPVLAMARWGLRFLDREDAGGVARGEWGFLAVQAMARGDRVDAVEEDYEFLIGAEQFHLALSGGRATAHRGPARRPAIRVVSDPQTFVAVGAGLVEPLAAAGAGRLTIDGDPAAVRRCIAMLGLSLPSFDPA
jgi:DNA-binding HxlR family transcriptional regulator